VDLGPFENLPSRSVLESRHPELIGKFVILFFGRVHIKKGFDLLAEALGRLSPDHPEMHLLVAGTDDGAWQPFHERIEQLGLTRRVTYVGHVSGERAREVWAAADAFVLPSYSEGFSMAILEALACRLPSVITTTCHFPEVGAADGAIVVEPSVADVSRGLSELLEHTPDELNAMANRGRRLVEQNYTWDRQAERLASVYRWVAGGGAQPEAVVS
jgi:glycosyltransferase involved in cell wall biosynthesis